MPLIFVAIISMLAPIIFARTDFLSGIFENVLGPNFSVVDLLQKYGVFIEFVLYAILFIGISEASLGRVQTFQGRGGKAVISVVGIALAISLAWFGEKNNFHIYNFGPLAGVLLVFIIFMAVYALIKGMIGEDNFGWQDRGFAVCLAIVCCISFVIALFKELAEWIFDDTGIVGGIISFIYLIAVIYVIYYLIRWAINMFSGGGAGRRGHEGNVGVGRRAARGAAVGGHERAAAERARQLITNIGGVSNDIQQTMAAHGGRIDDVAELNHIRADLDVINNALDELHRIEDIEKNDELEFNNLFPDAQLRNRIAEENNLVHGLQEIIVNFENHLTMGDAHAASEDIHHFHEVITRLLRINGININDIRRHAP